MTALIIFDDDQGDFGPLTDLRPAFQLRTGVSTTRRRIERLHGEACVAVRVSRPEHEVLWADGDAATLEALPPDLPVLCFNGRWAGGTALPEVAPGTALREAGTGDILAIHAPRLEAEAFLETGDPPTGCDVVEVAEGSLLRHPWDVLDRLPERLVDDIEASDVPVATGGAVVEGERIVRVHPEAVLHAGVVIDASAGPVLVETGAVVRPNAVLCGPCAVGWGSTINEHALIKANTVVGPCCKVGGEVGGTIFHGLSNKSHDGHLGDSLVGEWVNIGAGTTNSNLLNTYDEVLVRLHPDGPMHRTGRIFFGAVIGDHVKLAIGTRLMTGTILGTGAMISMSTPPPRTVSPFAWITDAGTHVYRLPKFLDVARRVAARRGFEPDEAVAQVLRDLHARASG